MLELADALDRAATLTAAAIRAGADAAEAVYHCEASSSVRVRLGRVEDIDASVGQSVGLRVFVGQRSASVSSADPDMGRLMPLVDRAVAMARAAPEDPFAGLAPEDRLLRGTLPALDLDDGTEADPAALRDAALTLEELGRAHPGITNSEGGGAAHSRARFAHATSHGFAGAYGVSAHSRSVSLLAGGGGGQGAFAQQRDHAHHAARHAEELEALDAIAARAAQRVVARVNPGRPPVGRVPVVFDPRVSGGLIGHLIGAMAGPAVARGTSFLLPLGPEAMVFPAGMDLVDDPHLSRGLRSRPFDGEGVATAPRALVSGGRLTGWLVDSASGRQLGLEPTGHAGSGGGVGVSNLTLTPGGISRDAMIADIVEGVLVTELIGQGVNGVTGDYSRGASGFAIRDGRIAEPVAEFTIAGNLLTMYPAMVAADDPDWRHAVKVPSIRIDTMTVAAG